MLRSKIIYKCLLLCCFFGSKLKSTEAQIIGIDVLGNKDKIEIPFSYEHDYIILKVKVDDKITLRFMFDTGAEHTILFEKIIGDLLGLTYDDRIKVIGSDLTQEVGALISRNLSIKLENAENVNRDLLVLEQNYLKLTELTGIDVDGIIGGGFFRNLVVNINYKKKKLVLYRPNKFAIDRNEYKMVDLMLEQQKPYFHSDVVNQNGDTVKLKLLVDTGAALTFLLNTDSHDKIELPSKVIKGTLGIGISGVIEGFIGKTSYLNLGEYSFQNIITNFQDVDSLFIDQVDFKRNGLIGNILLSRFDVYIDYLRSKMYLKARKNYNKVFEYDKSGMFLLVFGNRLDQFLVNYVVDGSPADEVGIQKGDVIKKVGCWSTSFYTLDKLTKKLSGKPGKTIRLKLERGEKRLKVKFQLRDMFEFQSKSTKI